MDTQVLVVGAGPTGLLLAAELKRRGVDCVAIDSLDAPLHWDRATVVHPRSLELFASLGIVDRLLDEGVPQRSTLVYSEGELLGRVDLDDCGSAYGFNLGLSEEVTESVLADYLRSRGGEVVRPRRLTSLRQDADGVVAGIDDGDGGTEIAAEWVVGCDGYHSATRELAGIELEGHDIADPWAVFDVTFAGWEEELEANFVYLEPTAVALTALPGGRWRVYTRPSSADVDLVAEATAVVAGYQPVEAIDVENVARFHCHSKVAERYRDGRVLLAGDAAHVCTPAEGHGMNSGLQDAANLAWKLALVCDGAARAALLDSYEAERRPVALGIAESGDAVEEARRTTEPDRRAARDRRLRASLGDPATRHQEAIANAELNISYAGSSLVAGEPDERLGPGELLPHLGPVRLPDGGSRFLDELAGRAGHTLLLLSRGRTVAELAPLLDELRAAAGGAGLVEAALALGVNPGDAERLGVSDLTVLAVRPDGYVGLRADGEHAEALRDYVGAVVGRQPR
jgi:2-polyprenyl-6-methoxyphenol hydroxylase-like FAD-dependent oxidoreductase